MEANNLMVVNSTDGQSSEILGKFLYYSFPRLLINKKEFKELVERYGFPASKREKHSAIDAFRCATTDVKDRIVEERNGEPNIARIYFRDNKRVSGNIISRELVEETVNEETNDYRKLANVQLDRNSGDIYLSATVSICLFPTLSKYSLYNSLTLSQYPSTSRRVKQSTSVTNISPEFLSS